MFGSKDKNKEKTSKADGCEACEENGSRTAGDTAEKEVKEGAAETEAKSEEAEKAKAAEESAAAKTDLEEQLAAAKEQNIRLLADFDNFRRRVIRERSETYVNAAEAVIREFLPFYDNFERAMSQAPKAGDPFADGIRMVFDQLKAAFSKNNVAAFSAVGSDFNPAEHDAIAYQPSKEAPEGKVIYQTCCGFKLGEKIIRPASVIVSSGDPDAPADESPKTEQAAEVKAGDAEAPEAQPAAEAESK